MTLTIVSRRSSFVKVDGKTGEKMLITKHHEGLLSKYENIYNVRSYSETKIQCLFQQITNKTYK